MSDWSRRDLITLAAAAVATADGTPRRPLPFDGDYRPKPLYFAMAEAFRAAPPR